MPRALAPLVLCLLACGGASARRDASTLTAGAWIHALESDDPASAWDLLASDVQQRTSFDDFAERWRATPIERRRQAQALGRALAAGARLGERARLDASGTTTHLVRDDDGWRLESPLLPAARARTPEEALKLLADAIDDRSINGVLRLLTSERQEAVRQLLDDFSTGLRDHLGDSIEVTKDRATLVWSDGTRRWRVVLKREQGAWRVDDFSQQ